MTKEIKQTKDIQTVIDELAIKGVEALNEMADFTQEQVDHIVHHAAIAALDKHMYLAKLAVDETGRGIYEDKAIKNMYASEYIWNSIKNDKTVGVIAEDKEQGLVSIAEPVGVICGVTPTTNPTSTTIFKALIALKTRNSIVFAFHPSAQKSSAEAARIVRDAAIEAGAPKNCIQWIEEPSIEATGLLMNHPKIEHTFCFFESIFNAIRFDKDKYWRQFFQGKWVFHCCIWNFCQKHFCSFRYFKTSFFSNFDS